MGCPVLALEVLSKIPKVCKKSGSSPLSKASSKANLNTSQPLENGTQGGLDWGSPAAPTQAWGGNDGTGGLDWSQPMVKVEEDELKLDWGDDKEDNEDEDEDDDGLTMKKPELETKGEEGSGKGSQKLQREDSQVAIISRIFLSNCGDLRFYFIVFFFFSLVAQLQYQNRKKKKTSFWCCMKAHPCLVSLLSYLAYRRRQIQTKMLHLKDVFFIWS